MTTRPHEATRQNTSRVTFAASQSTQPPATFFSKIRICFHFSCQSLNPIQVLCSYSSLMSNNIETSIKQTAEIASKSVVPHSFQHEFSLLTGRSNRIGNVPYALIEVEFWLPLNRLLASGLPGVKGPTLHSDQENLSSSWFRLNEKLLYFTPLPLITCVMNSHPSPNLHVNPSWAARHRPRKHGFPDYRSHKRPWLHHPVHDLLSDKFSHRSMWLGQLYIRVCFLGNKIAIYFSPVARFIDSQIKKLSTNFFPPNFSSLRNAKTTRQPKSMLRRQWFTKTIFLCTFKKSSENSGFDSVFRNTEIHKSRLWVPQKSRFQAFCLKTRLFFLSLSVERCSFHGALTAKKTWQKRCERPAHWEWKKKKFLETLAK